MDSAIIAKFDEAVRLFSQGNHVGATEALATVQQVPSTQLVPLLVHNVILANGGSENLIALTSQLTSQFATFGEAFGFTVQRHFYAFRLITHGITGDYKTHWRPKFDWLIQCAEHYLSINTDLLIGAADGALTGGAIPAALARMARPLSSEISSLWGVVWKLELCAVLTADDKTPASVDTTFGTLSGRLVSMLSECPRIALEPILTALVTSACEEFGLCHKASTQRGVNVGTHEAVRGSFTTLVLPQIALAAYQLLMKGLERGVSGMQQLSAGNHHPDIAANYVSLSATVKLLSVVFSWRFRNYSLVYESYGVTAASSSGGQYAAPDVLNMKDEQWRQLLESPTDASKQTRSSPSSSSPLGTFAYLIDAVALLTSTRRAVKSGGGGGGISEEVLDVALADTLQTFVQVCSIEGEFWDDNAKGHFGAAAWAAALALLDHNVSNGSAEVVAAACNALKRVLTSTNALQVMFSSPNAVATLVEPLTSTTTAIINKIGEEETAAASKFLATSQQQSNNSALISFEGDDGANGAVDVLLEGLDHLLNGWLAIVKGCVEDLSVRVKLADQCVQAIASGASQVLTCFVNAKVNMHSSHALLAEDGSEAPESSHAIEYANSNTELIAVIAREDAANVCVFLSQQLNNLSSLYVNNYVKQNRECPMALNEALWYVITVIAEYTGTAPESERACIPQPFISLAIRCEQQWPDDVNAQIANNGFLALCSSIFELCETLLPSVLRGTVSPGVCQALLDVLARYTATYLLADPFAQSERVQAFEAAFNSGTDAAKIVLSFLAASLKSFGSYPHVAESAVTVFQALMRLPKEFSSWMLSAAGSGLPPALAAQAGGVSNWFDFYTQCALGGAITLSSSLRSKVIGFLLSVAGFASYDELEAATGGSEEGFGFFEGGGGGGGKKTLTAEVAMATTIGRFTSHVANVLGAEMQTSIGNTIAVLECIGGMVDGLGFPLVVGASAMSGLTALVIASIEAACAAHSSNPTSTDRMALTAAAVMAEKVLVGIGCYFDTHTYVSIVRVALRLTQYVGQALRADKQKRLASGGNGGGNGSSALADGNDTVELLTVTSKMVVGIASWGAVDFSTPVAAGGTDTNATDRNQLVAQVSVEGLTIALDFLDETTVLIPELRKEVFKLMKEVTANYTGSMLWMMSAEASASLVQALNFAFNSGVPDLVEAGCSVVQSFAAYQNVSTRNQIQNPEASTAALTALLGSFLQRLAWTVLCVAIDPTNTACVGSALLEVTRALGPAAIVAAFQAEATASCPALLPAVGAFFAALQNVDIASMRRTTKTLFTNKVEKLITIAQGTRQLSA